MRKLIFLVVSMLCSNLISADALLEKYIEEPEMVGSGDFKAMFWKIYDAELYAQSGDYNIDDPFALKLIYSREIEGEAIADKSIELIRRQGVEDEILLAAWHRQLIEIFPDVKDGTEIVGVHDAGVGASFYVNGERVGLVKDLRFCQSFFGIWLAEDTLAPKLREELLGLASN